MARAIHGALQWNMPGCNSVWTYFVPKLRASLQIKRGSIIKKQTGNSTDREKEGEKVCCAHSNLNSWHCFTLYWSLNPYTCTKHEKDFFFRKWDSDITTSWQFFSCYLPSAAWKWPCEFPQCRNPSACGLVSSLAPSLTDFRHPFHSEANRQKEVG